MDGTPYESTLWPARIVTCNLGDSLAVLCTMKSLVRRCMNNDGAIVINGLDGLAYAESFMKEASNEAGGRTCLIRQMACRLMPVMHCH